MTRSKARPGKEPMLENKGSHGEERRYKKVINSRGRRIEQHQIRAYTAWVLRNLTEVVSPIENTCVRKSNSILSSYIESEGLGERGDGRERPGDQLRGQLRGTGAPERGPAEPELRIVGKPVIRWSAIINL